MLQFTLQHERLIMATLKSYGSYGQKPTKKKAPAKKKAKKKQVKRK